MFAPVDNSEYGINMKYQVTRRLRHSVVLEQPDDQHEPAERALQLPPPQPHDHQCAPAAHGGRKGNRDRAMTARQRPAPEPLRRLSPWPGRTGEGRAPSGKPGRSPHAATPTPIVVDQ